MATCGRCGQSIEWRNIEGSWHAKNHDGTTHYCRVSSEVTQDIPPRDAFCAKCFKPIYSNTRDVCLHTEPIWIRKSEVQPAKKLLQRQAREQAKLKVVQTRQVELRKYKCMLCGSTALRSNDAVICLADFSHTFPPDLYDAKI